ncbi:DUF4065 domain-containing protein [Leucobacter sp. USCH14]|uniref:Panacea domain-containing protein n=1 Tax=Leucobacter sp. USCH14 TaxID=3024838 RepID=UPI0030A42012
MSYTNASQSVLNVSDLIYDRLRKLGHAVETLKLQKLLYYSTAWSVTLRGRELFTDEIQAWKHGPVVASLYGFHSRKIVLDRSMGGDLRHVSPDDRVFINCVIDAYGDMSGWALREMTHHETPWIEAWEASQKGALRGYPISRSSMAAYFRTQPIPASLRGYASAS